MARLIIKNGYLKGGSASATAHRSNLVKYIATRDGVAFIHKNPNDHATKKQEKLIEDILREFPNTKESHEYEDYIKNPTIENASDFITISLEQHLTKTVGREKYLDYIANRPRVEIVDTHGLFTSGDKKIVLSQVAEEISKHSGNVWTPIISLRREDAVTTAYENANTWKSLISSKVPTIASSLKINIDNFRWYAAFHNESHHPHVHLICYSTDPSEGYLTTDGIRKMKSSLATEIFKQELAPLYVNKTQRRDELKKESEKVFRDLKYQFQNNNIINPKLEELITSLNQKLKFATGKKQYGYLRPPLKEIIDSIVDEMAKEPSVKNAYDLWCEMQNEIYSSYQDTMPDPLPLSKQKEFKSIKNMIINEVLDLNTEIELEQSEQQIIADAEPPQEVAPPVEHEPPFIEEVVEPQDDIATEEYPELTDDDIPPLVEMEMPTETNTEFYDGAEPPMAQPQEKATSGEYHVTWSKPYKQAKTYLFGDDKTEPDFAKSLELLKQESENKNALAIFDMARIYADGLGVEIDTKKAYDLYYNALLGFKEVETKKPWKYTQYRIGKMYAQGLGTEQDYETAAHWFELSAGQGYKFAQYSLGGLFYRGQGVEQDFYRAFDLYHASADQGFPYAQYETAKMYRDGIGTNKDEVESNDYFKLAFKAFEDLEKQSHDDKLQYRLGAMLQKGIGTEIDIPRAKKYFEQSAKLGNTFACYSLAKLILEDETSTAEEIETAISYLITASDGGNQFAQYSLAKVYLEEKYVDKDITKAMELLHLSAEQGNQFANYKLGKLYLGTEDIPKDIAKALHHLNLSAEEKNQFAEYSLGKLYLKGDDVPKDIDKALKYLTRSAEQKNQFAEYALGKLYLKGEDVPKDIAKALEYLTRSAEQDNEFAKYQLGVLYLKGEDVPKDIDKAILLLTEVAEKGNQFAQYQLGKLFLLGKDVEQDKETAIKWLTLSAEQGNEYAQFFIDNMDKWGNPSVGICALRLFSHMSRIFEDTIPQDSTSSHPKIDSKLLRKMREKKQAQGHKISGHEMRM